MAANRFPLRPQSVFPFQVTLAMCLLAMKAFSFAFWMTIAFLVYLRISDSSNIPYQWRTYATITPPAVTTVLVALYWLLVTGLMRYARMISSALQLSIVATDSAIRLEVDNVSDSAIRRLSHPVAAEFECVPDRRSSISRYVRVRIFESAADQPVSPEREIVLKTNQIGTVAQHDEFAAWLSAQGVSVCCKRHGSSLIAETAPAQKGKYRPILATFAITLLFWLWCVGEWLQS